MDFNIKLNEEMTNAAKTRDKLRLSAIRMIKAALHNKEIELMRPLNETEIMQILSIMTKQRKDSIEQFTKGKRMDLAQKEESELKIIQEFLPQQLSEDEIEALIKKAIAEAGAVSAKDMGKVMKILMPQITGRADGKAAGDKVKVLLSS